MKRYAKMRLAVILLAVVALGACAGEDDQATEQADDAWVPEPPAPAESGALVVARFQPGSGAEGQQVTGSVELHSGRLGTAPAAPADGSATVTDQAAGTDGPAQTPAGGDAAPRSGDSNPASMAGDDGFTVTVRLNGLAEGEHAWHIHSAPCGTDGPVVVPFTETENEPALDGPLTARAGGVAADTAFVPASVMSLDSVQATPHSLHVHAQGGVDHGPTVACADLTGNASGGVAMNLGAAGSLH